MRKKEKKKIRKNQKKCPFLTNRNLIYSCSHEKMNETQKHNIYKLIYIAQ